MASKHSCERRTIHRSHRRFSPSPPSPGHYRRMFPAEGRSTALENSAGIRSRGAFCELGVKVFRAVEFGNQQACIGLNCLGGNQGSVKIGVESFTM